MASIRAKCVSGWSGVDTSYNVMTIRAPAVLTSGIGALNENICLPLRTVLLAKLYTLSSFVSIFTEPKQLFALKLY